MTPKECPLTLSARGFHKGGESAVHVSDNSDSVDEVWGEFACLMSEEKKTLNLIACQDELCVPHTMNVWEGLLTLFAHLS